MLLLLTGFTHRLFTTFNKSSLWCDNRAQHLLVLFHLVVWHFHLMRWNSQILRLTGFSQDIHVDENSLSLTYVEAGLMLGNISTVMICLTEIEAWLAKEILLLIRLLLNREFFHQSSFHLNNILFINPDSIYAIFLSSIQLTFKQYSFHKSSFHFHQSSL